LISPGQRRHCKEPFKLPTRVHGEQIKPFVLVASYGWMRPGFGEAYIHMHFPKGVLPADWRQRTTQPPVVPRGPQWLLWIMRRMGMNDYA
jgi:hypothetical protein